MNVLNKVDLASRIKDVLAQEQSENTENLENAEEVNSNCNIDTVTDEQLSKIFTEDMVEAMDELYYREENDVYEDDMDFDIASMLTDSSDALINTIEYGNQVVKLGLEDLIENADDDGYITIDSVKGLISPNSKNVSNLEDIDNTPKTGDRINIKNIPYMG